MSGITRLNPDHVLKLALSAAALIASLAIAYYYVIFLPSKELANLELQKQEAKDEATAKSAAAASLAAVESQKKDMLTACLDDAQLNYNANWVKACQSQLLRLQTSLSTCSSDAEFCQNLYGSDIEQSKKKFCTLFGGSGQNVDDRLKEDKSDCYKRYN